MHLLHMGAATAEGKRRFLVAVGARGAKNYDFNMCRHLFLFLGVKFLDDPNNIFRLIGQLDNIQIIGLNAAFL